MKILHINTKDIRGGAAIAAYRLHQGLLNEGIESKLLVQEKYSDDSNVIGPKTKFGKLGASIKHEFEKIPFKLFSTREKGPWTANLYPSFLLKQIDQLDPDIIHLHLLTNSMLSIYEMGKIKKPLVWTMHDMWPFSGGFHYSNDYINHDGSSISKIILGVKKRYWKNLNINLVSPSKWLADLAQKSDLFIKEQVEVIQNPIDQKIFRQHDKLKAREIVGLEPDEKVILFGAVKATTDKRKGYDHLKLALEIFSEINNSWKVRLVIFGASRPVEEPYFPFPSTYLGRLYDQTTLSLLYSAADVVLVPSMLDNYPNVILESLACGTPVVAFNVGGIPEMINHKENGFLAEPFSPDDLSEGIQWCMSAFDHRHAQLLSDHSLSTGAQNYNKLYKKLV